MSEAKGTGVVFVHGLLSSSKSHKATVLRERFQKSTTVGAFVVPDLWKSKEEFEQTTVGALLPVIGAAVNEAAGPSHGVGEDGDIDGGGATGRRKVVIIGSSFGALVALRFMQTKATGSELVKGLVMMAPALHFAETLLRDEAAGPKLLTHFVHPGQRAFFGSLNHPTIMAEWERRRFLPVAHPSWRGTTAWGIKSMKDMLDKHGAVDGNSPRVPTLVIHGTADEIISPESSKRWLASLTTATPSVQVDSEFIEGGDHQLSNVEDKVMTRIEEWLTALDSRL